MKEQQRVLVALKMMEVVLNIHRFYFDDGTKWSKDVKCAIEGLRIANKTEALVTHDRVLTGRGFK